MKIATLLSLAVIVTSCGGKGFTGASQSSGGSAGMSGGMGVSGSAGASGSHAGTSGSAGMSGDAGTSGGAGQSGGAGVSGAAGIGGIAGVAGVAGLGGGSGTGGGTTCSYSSTSGQCGTGQYCNAIGCGMGTCVPFGAAETSDRTPVCGCDHVTYWNKSLAAHAGVPVSTTGECSGPDSASCGGFANLMCPGEASCNYRISGSPECGGSDISGTCWVVPKDCPPVNGFGPQNRACNATSCMEECPLILSGQPWYHDGTCPQ
jgi:hypothetical protein